MPKWYQNFVIEAPCLSHSTLHLQSLEYDFIKHLLVQDNFRELNCDMLFHYSKPGFKFQTIMQLLC
jgi:hypothetical protein